MKTQLFAAVAALALMVAAPALAATATTSAATSVVASGSSAFQLGAGTSAGASASSNISNGNASALALGPVFSTVVANSTTHGTASNANGSTAPLSLTTSFSFQGGTASSSAAAH